jgi:hypothetical protein
MNGLSGRCSRRKRREEAEGNPSAAAGVPARASTASTAATAHARRAIHPLRGRHSTGRAAGRRSPNPLARAAVGHSQRRLRVRSPSGQSTIGLHSCTGSSPCSLNYTRRGANPQPSKSSLAHPDYRPVKELLSFCAPRRPQAAAPASGPGKERKPLGANGASVQGHVADAEVHPNRQAGPGLQKRPR